MIIFKRILATFVDIGLLGAILAFVTVTFGEPTARGYRLHGTPVIVSCIFCFAYFVLMEFFFVATLGHLIFGLRVKSINGSKATFSQVLRRRLADFIELYFCSGVIALIVVLVNANRQRLGDLWAKTIVVNHKMDETAKMESELLNSA
jgi:uncharacterized RDD family membrane protein YckC